MSNRDTPHPATPLPLPTQERLKSIIADLGEGAALSRLRLPRHTAARALAGLPVREGTHALINERLGELERTAA